MKQPGRTCPLPYRYSPSTLARDAELQAQTPYIAGGVSAARVRIVASTHTCLPVAVDFETSDGPCALFNNGAAGMPNFRGTRYGLITRVGMRPSPRALYGVRIGAVHVEALAVDYDHSRWIDAFLASWPAGSAAHRSYFERLTGGPPYDLSRVARGCDSWSGNRHRVAVTGIRP